ncbi:Ribosomal protein L4 domain-containing protein [Cynara cardunculus var. scolymus]|uniref:Large ribosomal subunit protein uL4m n=1 Tax=Cynara cardunculus var. scolymus TaxID=59895 RepID=A0A118JYH2_CYNCS|nr:Ribosomal protein L4 domain-containing protein [Cynara cardunculus var. scolymus]
MGANIRSISNQRAVVLHNSETKSSTQGLKPLLAALLTVCSAAPPPCFAVSPRLFHHSSLRLLHTLGTSYKLHWSNHQDVVHQSIHTLSTALRCHDIGGKLSSMDYPIFRQGFMVLLLFAAPYCRNFSISSSCQEVISGLLQDLMIPVTNFNNEDKGFMMLAGDVFDMPIRKDIIHRVVRWQLAKRQQPRSHAFKLNKKVRRLGLKIALSARAAEGKASLFPRVLLVFDDLELPTHKTKNIVSYMKQMEETKKLLLVDGGPIDEKLKLATSNLHYVNVLPSIGLNVYSILLHDTLVMSRDAVNKIVERMQTPINR